MVKDVKREKIQHLKRNDVPRKAREKSIDNLNNLAVMMEIIESSISVEHSSIVKVCQKKQIQTRKTKPKQIHSKGKREELPQVTSSLPEAFDGNKKLSTIQTIKTLQNGELRTGRISHVMELEERRDLMSPAEDPLGPVSFEDFQLIEVKQELPDDLEYSKVTFTEIPLKSNFENACIKNPALTFGADASVTNKNIVSDQVTDTVLEAISINESSGLEKGQDFSEGNLSDAMNSNSDEDWEKEAEEVVNKETLPQKLSKRIPQQCNLCDKKLSSLRTLRLHKLKKHNEKVQLVCDICNLKFDLQRELLKHRNSTHRAEDGRFSCETCSKRFSDYHNFLLHRKTHESDNSLTCSDCWKLFDSSESLRTHFEEDHQNTNSESKSKLRNHARNHTCDTCGKSFTFNCLLQDHINLHTGAKPYLCQDCGRAFSQKGTLKQHEKTHSEVRPYQCTECPVGFYNRGDLIKHLRKHTGERPYICEVCGEGFSRSTHLGVHRRTHTGERPFSCDICGRAFTKRGDVVRHQRIHTGEFPYLCQVCGKSFRQSAQCANHIKSHHPDAPPYVAKNPNPYNGHRAPTHIMY